MNSSEPTAITHDTSNNPPLVDIVIVSYNTIDYTLRAIQSVFAETDKTDFNLIVVDNDSKDGSEEAIREQFPQVKLIQSGANLGFAGGVNLGTKNSTADYILLLNPDTAILDGAIDKLVEYAQTKPENGIWGGITLNNDHSINTHNAWAKPDTNTLLFSALGLSKLFPDSCFFNKANYGCWDRQSEHEVDILQGCFLLTSKVLWDKFSGLDESFFMYGEEADYCLKAIQEGYQPIITPTARIIHHVGVSEKNISGKMIKLLKGKAELINRHSRSWEKPLHKGLLFFYVFNKTISYSLLALIRKNRKSIANEWLTVFRQSRNWLKGYC